MRILTLRQGSPEWHAHRRTKFNASDAPAMLGESPHCTRTELLHRMAAGLAPEPDAATQRRFDAGHAVEALLRARAEQIVGEPLHAFVGVADFDERVSASFDGCTFMGDEIAECKLLNTRLRAAFADMETIAPEHRERAAANSLPIDYRIQMTQQARIAGAGRVLFLAGELRDDGTLGDVLSCWYYPDEWLWQRILSGWRQFEVDLAAYVPPAASAVEKIVAEPVQSLPAVSVIVSGEIAIRENFRVFEVALRDFLEHRLIREPKTDQDFADLDLQIKAMKGAEAALDGAEAQMLAQIQTVDQAKKTKDMLAKLVRDNRLMAEKLLASEKERRRGEIVAGGVGAIKAHVEALNKRLGRQYMPPTATAVDFGTAIKGMRSLASMEDAVATALARAKIAANETADRIGENLACLAESLEYAHLFPDTATIVLKAPDDCRALIDSRIAAHRAQEERRLEAERARIRAEEEARAAAKLRQEQEAREAEERRAHQATLTHSNGAPMFGQQVKENGDRLMLDDQGRRSVFCDVDEGEPASRVAPAAAGPAVIPMPTRTPAAQPGPPTLRLGDIKRHMAPLDITAEGLRQLGFEAAGRQGAAVMYRDDELPYILTAAIAHLTKAREQLAKAA